MNKYYVLFVEGTHDSEAIKKVLCLYAFRSLSRIDEVPKCFERWIPSYPHEKGSLDRFVPTPSFLVKENKCVAIVVSVGDSQIAEKLHTNIKQINERYLREVDDICFIGVVLDSDAKTCKKRKEDLALEIRKLNNEGMNLEGLSAVTINGFKIPFGLYAFPNDRDVGTLEDVLIDGAQMQFPALLTLSNDYVNSIPEHYSMTWKGSDEKKVIVGTIANVFRPGRASQVSIGEKDCDWFTEESIDTVFSHKCLFTFLDKNIGLL